MKVFFQHYVWNVIVYKIFTPCKLFVFRGSRCLEIESLCEKKYLQRPIKSEKSIAPNCTSLILFLTLHLTM